MEPRLYSDFQVDLPENLTSLPDFLLQKMKNFEDRKALIDPINNKFLTYRSLSVKIRQLGAGLWHQCGIRPEYNVGLVAPNCIEYPLTYLAIMSIGAVCVPINYLSSKYELKNFVEECEIDTIITTPELIEKFHYVQQNTPSIRKIVLIGNEPGFMSLDLLMENNTFPDFPRVNFNSKETLATISYSSGTTGKPKGCMHTHYSYIANVCQMSHPYFQHFLNGQDVTIAVLPMSHMYGQLVYLAHALAVGCTMVVLGRYHLHSYLSLIQQFRATLLHMVPPVIIEIIKSSLTDRFDLSSIRDVQTSAANISSATAEQFVSKLPQCSLTNGYGMTEIMFATKEERNKRVTTSIGRLLPNISTKVVDITGKAVGPEKDGELCFLTPSALKGYWKNPEETKNLIDDEGYVRTGDIGHYDKNGNFVIVDRKKDLIKYKANQVSPAELESIILRHPKVADVAVVGIPDFVAGELPRAYVVKKYKEILDDLEIIDFVKKYVSPYKRLRGGVVFVENVPKSPTGKILRNVLRDSSTRSSKL